MLVESSTFNIKQIEKAKQCFRLKEIEAGRFEVVSRGKHTYIRQYENGWVDIMCDKPDEEFWKIYFDLGTDYLQFIDSIPSVDSFLEKAARNGKGLRILKQDFWETLVTFMIRQNNTVGKTTRAIDAMCEKLGTRLVTNDGTEYFTFPSPDKLADIKRLGDLKLGYRDEYISTMAKNVLDSAIDLTKIQAERDREKQRKMLISIHGVGEVVADTVMLFGLGYMDSFPTDSLMQSTLDSKYDGCFPLDKYKGCAGVMQQYITYYAINGGA